MAEGGGLLNRYRVKSSIGGSNPPLSAIPETKDLRARNKRLRIRLHSGCLIIAFLYASSVLSVKEIPMRDQQSPACTSESIPAANTPKSRTPALISSTRLAQFSCCANRPSPESLSMLTSQEWLLAAYTSRGGYGKQRFRLSGSTGSGWRSKLSRSLPGSTRWRKPCRNKPTKS